MGDMADDLTENELLQLELHQLGLCGDSDCPYCIQEKIWDEE
jgi:hypothetical protein